MTLQFVTTTLEVQAHGPYKAVPSDMAKHTATGVGRQAVRSGFTCSQPMQQWLRISRRSAAKVICGLSEGSAGNAMRFQLRSRLCSKGSSSANLDTSSHVASKFAARLSSCRFGAVPCSTPGGPCNNAKAISRPAKVGASCFASEVRQKHGNNSQLTRPARCLEWPAWPVPDGLGDLVSALRQAAAPQVLALMLFASTLFGLMPALGRPSGT